MSAVALAASLFCAVSGGPYGLEKGVQAAGPAAAIVLILALPFIWALPDALTTAELASAIPEEGGYVAWVGRAFGPFLAFLNAWWTWLYSIVDASIYPVMFVNYLGVVLSLFGMEPKFLANPIGQWVASCIVIVVFCGINVLGARPIGKASQLLTLAVVAPFVGLVAVGIWQLWRGAAPAAPALAHHNPTMAHGLTAGLAIMMWNYLGWDSLSTVAGEVENPAKAFPRALMLGLPFVALVYLVPTLVTLRFVPNTSLWNDQSWPNLAMAVGGLWLAAWVGFGGIASPLAQFGASVLGSSRIPQGLAGDGFLPKMFLDLHPEFGTPAKTILLSAALFALLATKTFQSLVELNVVLFSAALLLEGLSLLKLRKVEPNLNRPFKIKGGWPVLIAVALCPAILSLILVVGSIRDDGWNAQLLTVIAILSGPLLYKIAQQVKIRRLADQEV